MEGGPVGQSFLQNGIGVMFDLGGEAVKLMQTRNPAGGNYGPDFLMVGTCRTLSARDAAAEAAASRRFGPRHLRQSCSVAADIPGITCASVVPVVVGDASWAITSNWAIIPASSWMRLWQWKT